MLSPYFGGDYANTIPKLSKGIVARFGGPSVAATVGNREKGLGKVRVAQQIEYVRIPQKFKELLLRALTDPRKQHFNPVCIHDRDSPQFVLQLPTRRLPSGASKEDRQN